MTRIFRAACQCGDAYETPSELLAEAHADNHETETGNKPDVWEYED